MTDDEVLALTVNPEVMSSLTATARRLVVEREHLATKLIEQGLATLNGGGVRRYAATVGPGWVDSRPDDVCASCYTALEPQNAGGIACSCGQTWDCF